MSDSTIIFIGLFSLFLTLCIIAGILRWVFRINRSIYLLEQILQELRDNKTTNTKTRNGIVISE
jgi:hypothetical protein